MFRNYLKVTIRNFYKNRFYATLNTLGLAIGFAAFILLYLYFYHESHYEDFHHKADRIYRISWKMRTPTGETGWARIHHDFLNRLPEAMPEIEHLIRFQNQERKYVRIGTDKFRPPHAYQTDKEVFEVFDLELLEGHPSNALAQPRSVVISEKLAQNYFGGRSALGQEILVTGAWNADETPYKVTGIMQDLPAHTHLPADVLFSFSAENDRTGWAYTYLLLKKGTDISAIESKIGEFVVQHLGEEKAFNNRFEFQALSDIHLHSNLSREIVPNGNAMYARAALYAAIFILLIALINFINLSSALSVRRAREIGIRKIIGAASWHNRLYAFTESVSYNVLAMLMGMLLVFLAYPFFTEVTGTEFRIDPWIFAAILLGIAIFCGILSGIYPGIVLNSIDILQTSKGNASPDSHRNGSNLKVRKIFIGIQLTVSIALIAITLISYRQFHFIKNKDLGLNREQVLAVPGVAQSITKRYPVFKENILPLPGVKQVAACMQVPSEAIQDGGFVSREGQSAGEQLPLMDLQPSDPDFIELLGIELLAGKIPESSFPTTSTVAPEPKIPAGDMINNRPREYVLNATAARQLGFPSPEEAIGHKISWSNGLFHLQDGPITGIVRDFHQENFKTLIDPVVMTFEPNWLQTFLISLRPDNIPETVRDIELAWDRLFPKYPLEYFFLDEMYDQLYKAERLQLQILLISSGLALILALTGLFGLIALTLKTRMREIAIRKVLGASPRALIELFGKEYLGLLVISSLLAVPFSLWWAHRWLENFAYRISISPLTYLTAIGLVTLLLAATVGLQTYSGTKINPAQKLYAE